MRLLIPLVALASGLLGGCSAGKTDDGANNPPAKRLTDSEYESQRTKKGGDEPGH